MLDPRDPVGTARHVSINASEEDSLQDVRAALSSVVDDSQALFVGPNLLPETGTVADADLPEGAVLALGAPGPALRIDRPWTRLELRVTGGPAAGAVFPLPPGDTEVGRGVAGAVVSDDTTLSRRHFKISVGDTVEVQDLGSSNGTYVEGQLCEEPTQLRVGSVVQAGGSLFQVVDATRKELELTRQEDGSLGLNRRFRSGFEDLPREVHFPEKPNPGERPSFNLLMTIAPSLAMGSILVAVTLTSGNGRMHPAIFGMFLMSPIVGFVGGISRRRSYDRKLERDRQEFADESLRARDELIALRRDELDRLRTQSPDPAAVVQIARATGRDLWARTPTDSDLLTLRVGSGPRRSAISAGRTAKDDPQLWMAPVNVDLKEVGGLALVGALQDARAAARSLILQLATLHSPREVKIVIITGSESEADWGWAQWLPHLRWAGDEAFLTVGCDSTSRRNRLSELRRLLKGRQQASKSSNARQEIHLPAVVVVYDSAESLMAQGFAEVVREGRECGIYAVTIDELQIPEGCNASLHVASDGSARLELENRPTQAEVVADFMSAAVAEVPARCLAPLKLIGERGATELPASLRLLDVIGWGEPDPELIADSWRADGRSSAATVGVSVEGPLEIDITQHGVHGVVAGTTRSGKSEFLKTYVAALAARNHPDALSFLFIDFKGGNDWQVAASLPHTVALSTNQDLADFLRTMQLLESELARRQRIAATLQTATIEAYWEAQRKAKTPSETLGRLIVIADEFAEFKRSHPDEIDRMVSIARTGAAYGVHLILATQRPAGAVSGDIDANAGLRVCFRTTDEQNSNEVLKSPDAAAIAERHRGRGYMRANSDAPIEFQCARVGNARPGVTTKEPIHASPCLWASAGHLPPETQRAQEVPDPDTDFFALAQALQEAAALSGWTENAVPWPRPLPPRVYASDLALPGGEELHAIPFALADNPDRQTHEVSALVFGSGHVGLAGSERAGRATALRAAAITSAQRFSPDELHIYAIDFAGRELESLQRLPHCGAVAEGGDEVTSRLLDHLEAEVSRRLTLLRTADAADVSELKRRGGTEDSLPWILLLVNGCERLTDLSSNTYIDVAPRIGELLNEGRSAGLQGVLAGDKSLFTRTLGDQLPNRLVMRFNNPDDYYVAGLKAALVPSSMGPGRAVSGAEGRTLQIAMAAKDLAGEREMINVIAEKWPEHGVSSGPAVIKAVPRQISLARLMGESAAPSTAEVPVLVGFTASHGGLWLDLGAETSGFTIGGPARSGRSTLLATLGISALSRGVAVAVVAPRQSPAADLLDGREGVLATWSGRGAAVDVASIRSAGPCLLLIDDADSFVMTDDVRELLSAKPHNLGVAVATTVEGAKEMRAPWLDFRKSGHGAVLLPRSRYDAGGFVPKFPATLLASGPVGRGVVIIRNAVEALQAPSPG